MINKLITRFVYLTSLKVVTVALSILLGAPFFVLLSTDIPLTLRIIHSLASGLMLSLPVLSIIHNMRQGNRFWRQLGEARDLLEEAQNLSDLNWLRNGHLSDLMGMLGEAKTREANLQMVAELHRLREDIERRHREIMGYYELEK
jgi:biopolymer transport protein ExbB/TolQ